MLTPFLHGFILSFGLIVPLGAQNIFIFNQAATQKRFIHALPVIFIASICDTVLISLAVLGVSLVILTTSWLQLLVFSICFIFLFLFIWDGVSGVVSQIKLKKRLL